jgi:hypothetical protein
VVFSLRNFVKPYVASSWSQGFSAIQQLGTGWVFRGRASAEWGLQTSLERQSAVADVAQREAKAMEEFRLFPPPGVLLPNPVRALDLLAVMQHFRRPTRFLDFTDNPKVAAYFAAATCDAKSSDRMSIWAIREQWLEELARQKLSGLVQFSSFSDASYLSDPVAFVECFLKNQITFIATIRVSDGFKRIEAQSGLFVAAGNISQPFEWNFRNTRYQHEIHRQLMRFDIPATSRDEMLDDLAGAGITESALFPD